MKSQLLHILLGLKSPLRGAVVRAAASQQEGQLTSAGVVINRTSVLIDSSTICEIDFLFPKTFC